MAKNVDFLSKPVFSMTGEDFSSLLKYTFPELSKNTVIAHGIKELKTHLGCGFSKVNELSRQGVFNDAIVSSIGKKKLYDVEKARELANQYQKEHKNNK